MTAAARLGALVRDLPPLFTAEKPVSFDPVQTTFLQKLVRESTLKDGITVAKEDFFQAIVYVDWFTEIVASRPALLADVAVMVEELERIEEVLDPDLVMLVRYSGLYAVKDLRGEALLVPPASEQVARRHERANVRPTAGGAADVDLFHLAVGRMVADMSSRPLLGPCLAAVEGRADLRAVIAMDAILGSLGDTGEAARAALAAGTIAPAALALVGELIRASAGWSLREHVERLHARLVKK